LESIEERLSTDVRNKVMKESDKQEILEQKKIFDSKRKEIEKDRKGDVVGFADGNMIVGETVHEVMDSAKKKYPGKLVYFEALDYGLFT